MCGIFGIVEPKGVSPSTLARMGDLLKHRGPDGDGFVLFRDSAQPGTPFGGRDTPAQAFDVATLSAPRRRIADADLNGWSVGLGHRRLAIVDLSAMGHQPMASPRGDHWIVFNGEIYNHLELRVELEALGHRFVSHSDTEVILAAYQQWGVECLHRFNGMWALAIYDRTRDQIFMARDRFGVKPLHFWRDHQTFLFASEIKAFLAHPRFTATPNVEHLRHYLVDGPVEWTESTAFADVFRLQAASFIVASPSDLVSGRFEQVRWWRLAADDTPATFNEAQARAHAEQYRALLRSAVELRLRADVTVGSALSGGLDSTSVVYLVAQLIEERGITQQQETFTSVYRSPGTEHCDESKYVEEVGSRLRVHQNSIEPRAADIPAEHARMIWHLDTPPESTLMSSWHTFKLVNSKAIKVTLDGQGADEQLAGYVSYLPIALARQGMGATLELPGLLKVHSPRIAIGAVGLALAAGAIRRSGLARSVRGRRAHVLGQLGGGLNAALVTDSFSGLSNLLHYADRTSMAFSVESRMPFLDYRLAEFLAKLPSAYKIHDGWTKYVARQAFADKLPDSVVWRKDKMGWPIPEQTWERGELKEWFARHRSAQQKMAAMGLEREFIDAMNDKSITRRVRALNLETWHRTFIDGEWKAAQASESS